MRNLVTQLHTIWVAGYADLTGEKFATHYVPRLEDHLAEKRNPVI